ncbi:hypothetical protein FN846DRAFT_348351 [Sphaerosporella brunnea]|uniref:Uncharacterized protein n=1 Tax=Sphaerosporella brunnea TaxID=1250544 RepID=A0A5J5EJG5_9PEZI|nr:hypothetical protein FN846DRAFT_348351 [Sphaerosporella brunnea]
MHGNGDVDNNGGVLPLQALDSLEAKFTFLTEISGPIQEHFDLAIGTSPCGLVVFGLFINGWSVRQCSNQFVRLAKMAFSRPQSLVMAIHTDSRYRASDMEQALKKAFGTERARLDWSEAANRYLTTKVAVTATTTDTSSACIFGNYNGEGSRPSGCGMFASQQ